MSVQKIIMRDREAAMNVKSILAAKKRNLGGDIVSIEPTANLAAAAKSLSAHRIGAVLIRGKGGRLAGILSERDIVRALSEHGADALALPVGQVMTREVATCGEDDSCAFFFSSRRRHTRCLSEWSSDVCSSDLGAADRHPGDDRRHLTPGQGEKELPWSL